MRPGCTSTERSSTAVTAPYRFVREVKEMATGAPCGSVGGSGRGKPVPGGRGDGGSASRTRAGGRPHRRRAVRSPAGALRNSLTFSGEAAPAADRGPDRRRPGPVPAGRGGCRGGDPGLRVAAEAPGAVRRPSCWPGGCARIWSSWTCSSPASTAGRRPGCCDCCRSRPSSWSSRAGTSRTPRSGSRRAGRCATCRRPASRPGASARAWAAAGGGPGRSCSLTGNVSRTSRPCRSSVPAERLDPVCRPLQLGAAGPSSGSKARVTTSPSASDPSTDPDVAPCPPQRARCSRTRRRPPRPPGHRCVAPGRMPSTCTRPPRARRAACSPRCASNGGLIARVISRSCSRASVVVAMQASTRPTAAGGSERVAAATAESRSGTSRSPLTTPTLMAAATWRRPESSAASRRWRDAARSAFTRASRVAPARSDSSRPVVAKAGPARSQNSRSTRRRDADGARLLALARARAGRRPRRRERTAPPARPSRDRPVRACPAARPRSPRCRRPAGRQPGTRTPPSAGPSSPRPRPGRRTRRPRPPAGPSAPRARRTGRREGRRPAGRPPGRRRGAPAAAAAPPRRRRRAPATRAGPRPSTTRPTEATATR